MFRSLRLVLAVALAVATVVLTSPDAAACHGNGASQGNGLFGRKAVRQARHGGCNCEGCNCNQQQAVAQEPFTPQAFTQHAYSSVVVAETLPMPSKCQSDTLSQPAPPVLKFGTMPYRRDPRTGVYYACPNCK